MSNKVEYLDNEESYKYSTKEVLLSFYSQNTKSVPLPQSVAIYCSLLYFSVLDID